MLYILINAIVHCIINNNNGVIKLQIVDVQLGQNLSNCGVELQLHVKMRKSRYVRIDKLLTRKSVIDARDEKCLQFIIMNYIANVLMYFGSFGSLM